MRVLLHAHVRRYLWDALYYWAWRYLRGGAEDRRKARLYIPALLRAAWRA